MKILLDIDGVLVTTPGWRKPELHEDGFLIFNDAAAYHLKGLIAETNATVVLTSTHRIKYGIEEWKERFKTRGIIIETIEKINECHSIEQLQDRATEIMAWAEANVKNTP